MNNELATTMISAVRCLRMSEIEVGQARREAVEVTESLFRRFVELSGDTAPGHTDEAHARRMGFDRCVLHGFLVGMGYSRLLGMFLPGGNTVIHSIEMKMLAPAYVGDTLTYETKVVRIIEPVKSVQLELTAVNQNGVVVNKGTAICVFRVD
jgi:acyl dehydratase